MSLRVSLPPVIGHRGAAAIAPENTLAGLRAAAAAGARWVEVDAKLTADGVVVLMHDDTLDRTTNGTGPVARQDYASLAALDAGSWFGPAFAGEKVPTLQDMIDTLAELGMGANIEIKPCPGRERETAFAVAELVQAKWPAHLPPPVLSSFERASLEAARDRAPDLPRGYLVEALVPGWQQEVAALGCVSLHLGAWNIDADTIAAAQAAGLPIAAWTVNDPAQAAALRATGVAAIITDDPATLV